MADVGDFVGIKGTVMLTRTGEPTVKCEEYTHLTKALRPLPELLAEIPLPKMLRLSVIPKDRSS